MAENITAGFFACIISTFFFGSMFVPVKPFETHDGFFVQWIMGCAIFMVGLIVNAIVGFPRFYPLAMLGGALWATENTGSSVVFLQPKPQQSVINTLCAIFGGQNKHYVCRKHNRDPSKTQPLSGSVFGVMLRAHTIVCDHIGNITAIPIVNAIGMGLGILIWSFTNLLFGWASGRFGWFGLKPQIPASDTLNYLGMVFSLVSAVMFFFVKPSEDKRHTAEKDKEDKKPLMESEEAEPDAPIERNSRATTHHKISNYGDIKHISAVTASLLAGVFYGLNFAPVIYIQDNYEGASKNGLHYVFAHYCGVFAACTLYFLCYCAYRQNVPKINPRSALPAFGTGVLWAIAQTAWFVANENLSEAISFPIITRFPGIVASLWGVFYFREIRGRKNLQVLLWSILITVVGGILSGLSKIINL